MTQSKPTKQAERASNGVSPRSGVAPPKERRFGEKNGNPRHNGAWKKENTLRYKWEKILEMNETELKEVLKDPKCGRVEQMTAEVLLDRSMKATEKIAVMDKLATQVYGQPKQAVETTIMTPQPLSPRRKRREIP